MGDYLSYWLSLPERVDREKLPKIFFVNWFRKDEQGRWLWPGYGENSRVLKWICERVEGTAAYNSTPIGHLPTVDSLDLNGLRIDAEKVKRLLEVDREGWQKELNDIEEFYQRFDGRIPSALWEELRMMRQRLRA